MSDYTAWCVLTLKGKIASRSGKMLPLLAAAVIVADIAVVYANTVSGTVKKIAG